MPLLLLRTRVPLPPTPNTDVLGVTGSQLVSASQGEASRWSIFSQGKIGAGPDIVIAGPGVIGSAQTHLYS